MNREPESELSHDYTQDRPAEFPPAAPPEINGGCVLCAVLFLIVFLTLLFVVSVAQRPPRTEEVFDPETGELYLIQDDER